MTSIIKASPKEISVTESYNYEIGVRKNAFINMDLEPEGTIDIFMPYDGEIYFPKDMADELSQQKDLDTLRLGWLALGEPKNWSGDWSQKIGAEILEVNIPLRTNGINDEKWSADEDLVQLHHEYKVERPRYYPLNIDLEVLDNEATSRFTKGLEITNKPSSSKKSLLSFEVFVQVELPINQDSKDIAVQLEKLTFAWPKFAPKNQIEIHLLQRTPREWKRVDWAYMPERNEIEVVLEPLRMEPNPAVAGSPLTTFGIIFHVDVLFSVGELIKKDTLAGRVTFKIENLLLSGRSTVWVNADGYERQETTERIHCQTLIISDFNASLSDRFANKQSFISREWRFSGVSFSPARTRDIKSILQDYGYSIAPEDNNENGIFYARRSIIQPEHEPYILDIFITVTGTDSTTTKRERKEAKEDVYITEISTQDLKISVNAQINGPGRMLALDIDAVMLKLKDHFTAVADLR